MYWKRQYGGAFAVQAQTLLTDSISGATCSGKVILLVIYDALENAAGV
ncbi:MAG: hypothetical protein ABIK64_01360 [Bacillota bacterium]